MTPTKFMELTTTFLPEDPKCDWHVIAKIHRRRRVITINIIFLVIITVCPTCLFVYPVSNSRILFPPAAFANKFTGILYLILNFLNIIGFLMILYGHLHSAVLYVRGYYYFSGYLEIKISIILKNLENEPNEELVYRNLRDLVDVIQLKKK